MPRVGSFSRMMRGAIISHLPITSFCWLPPDSDAGRHGRCRRCAPRAAARCASTASRSAARSTTPQCDSWLERREREVVAHRHRQHQAFGLAVLGDQRHADLRALGVARAADVHRLAVDQQFAAACRAARRTAPAAARAGPGRRGRRGRSPRRRAACSEMSSSRSSQRRWRTSRRGAASARGARGRAAGTPPLYSRPIISSTTSCVGLGAGRVACDAAAVAEHRAFVGELGDLVHAVRDVDQREALRRAAA